jgi:hypothetical protein
MLFFSRSDDAASSMSGRSGGFPHSMKNWNRTGQRCAGLPLDYPLTGFGRMARVREAMADSEKATSISCSLNGANFVRL